MLSRRNVILGAASFPALCLLSQTVSASSIPELLNSSRLIYLTPIKSNGDESKCKGEVWFQYFEEDIYVVTQAEAWRADAVRQGLNSARVWVGEYGVWDDADGAFREAPELMVNGSLETDEAVHTAVLEAMGSKYTDEWGVWGPRFRTGLRDGNRVMLHYTIA